MIPSNLTHESKCSEMTPESSTSKVKTGCVTNLRDLMSCTFMRRSTVCRSLYFVGVSFALALLHYRCSRVTKGKLVVLVYGRLCPLPYFNFL